MRRRCPRVASARTPSPPAGRGRFFSRAGRKIEATSVAVDFDRCHSLPGGINLAAARDKEKERERGRRRGRTLHPDPTRPSLDDPDPTSPSLVERRR
ncbi:hypothetical protein GW17_00018017 [Ensete ventricosum]|nr:hypothetical protein GW17_00018017 [Ensete ventricosum]